jgi:hypothetical protein
VRRTRVECGAGGIDKDEKSLRKFPCGEASENGAKQRRAAENRVGLYSLHCMAVAKQCPGE